MPLNEKLESTAFYGTLAAIFLSSIPYGTADPISKSVLCVAISIFAAIRLAQGLAAGTVRPAHLNMFLPLTGILLIALIQILPIPFLSEKSISSDPYETKIFIMSFATLLVAAEVLSHYTNSARRLRALIVLALVTAAASAFFGIMREAVLDGRYGLILTYFPPHSQDYAQFINRNHFTFLIEMALGLTIGLLLKGQLAATPTFVFVVLSAVFSYTVITAGSRGGVVSCAALTALAVFVHFMTKRKWRRSRDVRGAEDEMRNKPSFWRKTAIATALCCVTLGIAIFSVAFVGDDVVYRMERIENEVVANRMNRLSIWTSTVQLIKEHPVLGTGFGAYSKSIPKYVVAGGGWKIEQAHNEYLEILANGGVVAFVLFTIFGVLVSRRALNNFGSYDPLVRSSCFGALIGIFGVMIHNIVDYGLHIMVNALIFVVLIVIATARVPQTARRSELREI